MIKEFFVIVGSCIIIFTTFLHIIGFFIGLVLGLYLFKIYVKLNRNDKHEI